ncbi:Alpha/Beta hydrolase protein [Syncephalis fuscata]|nr:Alpha/Beta hydrolase protein [Syncephalis fuscata]
MDQFTIDHHVLSASGNEDLQLAVNVYTPRSSEPVVDVILAHANGYHKELWHPVIKRLGHAKARFVAYDIRNQGDSAALNAGRFGKDDFRWTQNVADIQTIIKQLKLHKPILGIGHSIGGATVLSLEENSPGTFDRVISIDPVCSPLDAENPMYQAMTNSLVSRSSTRRFQWMNREEAKQAFLKRAFFKVWDEEVLDLHLEYGLKENPVTGEVTLKCTPEQEVNTFIGNNISKQAHDDLPKIQCPVLFIGGQDSEYNPPENTENNAKSCKYGRLVMLDGVGHLVPMEQPKIVADYIFEDIKTLQRSAKL